MTREVPSLNPSGPTTDVTLDLHRRELESQPKFYKSENL